MRLYKDKGFTLVEVLMTMVVISAMTLIATPAILSWLPGMRLKAAANDLVSSMQQAKIAAINTNTNSLLVFNNGCGDVGAGAGYTFTDAGGTVITSTILRNGVCLALLGGAVTSGFNSRGGASDTVNLASVRLSHPDQIRNYTITQTVAGGVNLQ